MFIFNWLLDKLGYMPKITTQVEVVKPQALQEWSPFPPDEVGLEKLAEKPVPVKKPAVKKPTVKRASTRTKKAKQ
jgi:hypothetical protein